MTTTKSVSAATTVLERLRRAITDHDLDALERLTHIRAIFDPDGLLVAPHVLPVPAAASREPVCC